MSVLITGFPTYFGTPESPNYLSQGRATYRRANPIGEGTNNLFFHRRQYAVYKTTVKPATLTTIATGWAADSVAASFTATIIETGTLGADAINAKEIFNAAVTGAGLLGADAINAKETFSASVTGVGSLGTDHINASVAAAGYTATISEIGTLGVDAINAREIFNAVVTGVGTLGTDTINVKLQYIATLAEIGILGADAINGSEGFSAAISESGTIGVDTINGQAGVLSYEAAIAEVGQAPEETVSGTVTAAVIPEEPYVPLRIVPILPFARPAQIQRVSGVMREEGQRGSTAISAILSFDAGLAEIVDSIGRDEIHGGRRNDKSRAAILHYLRVA